MLVVGLNYAPETTGIGPYTSGMCAALSEQWDVTVATAHPHYPEWRVTGAGGWRSVERRDGPRVVRYGLARRWHVPSAVVVQDLYSKAVSEVANATKLRRPAVPG